MAFWFEVKLSVRFVRCSQTQFQEIEKTRETLEQQKSIERVAIDKKLKTAANMRDENIKKMLDRLKEHVSLHFTKNFCLEIIS